VLRSLTLCDLNTFSVKEVREGLRTLFFYLNTNKNNGKRISKTDSKQKFSCSCWI
jgi:hypothetical protein